MASLSTNKSNGRRKIQFTLDGKRRTIHLGKVPKRQAEFVKLHIEKLVSARITGHSVTDQTSAWVSQIESSGDKLAEDLARHGLIERTISRKPAQLEPFIDSYIESRTDVKPATKEIWRQGKLGLTNQFGPSRLLGNITPGDADTYRLCMLGDGLAPYTVRKRLQFAKMVFRAAVRHRAIKENPFDEVTVKVSMKDRMYFVTRDQTEKILSKCPSTDWKLIVSLSRYGGLRCPSEVLSLRWCDVLWPEGKVIVASPKTEHHIGKDSRMIPLFPELHEMLSAAFEQKYLECGFAPEKDGETYIVDKRFRMAAIGDAGWRNVNLRTTLGKIIKRAGLMPWPRLLHNLRSSRETELAEEYPIHVVAAWMGHSVEIATKHYTQITDEHFRRACVTSPIATQNPTQHATANARIDSQPNQASIRKPRKRQLNAAQCEAVRSGQTDGVGFEPTDAFQRQ